MSITETHQPSRFKLRQERLARLGALPAQKLQAALPPKPKKTVEPYPPEFGWDRMWFYELVFGRQRKLAVSPRMIQIETAEYFGLSHADLLSRRRTDNLVMPRHLAIYITKVLTPLGFAAIGRKFAGRDHSTVIHACLKMESLVGVDEKITAAFIKIRGAFL